MLEELLMLWMHALKIISQGWFIPPQLAFMVTLIREPMDEIIHIIIKFLWSH